ncbi:HDOD domain-containing protein [Phytobacter palmae]|uniref:HDOD domain-containing protein n=1 Tax=Phytobacter palmae TaxID=1855371 RepID=A0ABU9V4K0_9ENTR
MQVMFVDDENRILSGIERAVMMHNPDWECRFASSGPQALAMLEETPADVVVSDMRMPFMDGAELLAQVRDRRPGTVRIILSGYSEPTSTQRMLQVAHQFVSKPCDSTVLIEMIESTLTRRSALEEPLVIDRVGQLSHLPAVPEIIAELQQRLSDSDIHCIAGLVGRDPALAARFMQMANSAWFTRGAHIHDIGSALTQLGLEQIKLFIQTPEFFTVCSSDPRVNKLQRNAFIASQLAARICGHQGLESTAALLAGIALLVPDAHVSSTSRATVSAYMLALWGLPGDLVDIVARHAEPSRFANNLFGAIGAVHVAVALAHDDVPDHVYLEQTGMLNQLPLWQQMLAHIKETLHD